MLRMGYGKTEINDTSDLKVSGLSAEGEQSGGNAGSCLRKFEHVFSFGRFRAWQMKYQACRNRMKKTGRRKLHNFRSKPC